MAVEVQNHCTWVQPFLCHCQRLQWKAASLLDIQSLQYSQQLSSSSRPFVFLLSFHPHTFQPSNMSANDAEQLRQSLDQAISMQLNEMPRAIDLDPDEVLAQQIQQQELTTSITSTIPASARTRPQRAIQQADQDCSSCVENTRGRDLIVLECCQTAFCKICFRTWFETALDGKALPSCCGETIAPEGYGTNLTVAIKKKHGQVRAELNAERKIYCGNARCGKFIEVSRSQPDWNNADIR